MNNIINAYMPMGAFGVLVLVSNLAAFMVMMSAPSINPDAHSELRGFNLARYRRDCFMTLFVGTSMTFISLIAAATIFGSGPSDIKPSRYVEAGILWADDCINDALPLLVLILSGAALLDFGSDLVLNALTRGRVRTLSSGNAYVVFITYVLSAMIMIIIIAATSAGSR